ncbi:GLPGLI family protein [Flavobacterium sp. SM15]|uniref:GLPGLI family protein n=1 Tax=Flavobacterium sp. SM15 TaxID=2908005 RepID=UPI001EDC2B66|nr:GLPGLI family protein [Flavobacterium sp. SM15]MCG2609930.1 GLPGLI family protein [Flavobacterium sp. SM15]
MKKSALVILAVFAFSISAFAQEFQGMAVYESKTSTSDFKSRMDGNKEMTPEMRKMIEERVKKMMEKTFILNFDKSASIYKEEEKLDAPGQSQGGFRMMSSMMGVGGTYYKNVKEKSYTVDKEFMGKEFLVVDTLPKLNWKLENETKKIGDYTCFKATAVKKVSASDFRQARPKKEEEAKKDEKTTETPKGRTNFMTDFEMPKEVTITAWYTPEIPINQGPESYWGLPGLILEVNDGKTIIMCSKVVMNTKDKVEIKAPKNGKVVKQKEFDETVLKKMEEMREQFQSQGGNRGGMQIRMGGH